MICSAHSSQATEPEVTLEPLVSKSSDLFLTPRWLPWVLDHKFRGIQAFCRTNNLAQQEDVESVTLHPNKTSASESTEHRRLGWTTEYMPEAWVRPTGTTHCKRTFHLIDVETTSYSTAIRTQRKAPCAALKCKTAVESGGSSSSLSDSGHRGQSLCRMLTPRCVGIWTQEAGSQLPEPRLPPVMSWANA